ncbi:MAG TPA: LysE family translocator [Steroidobacteraceae bacterium]|nr:LysE family translocator [Steroidobacteraceae bacterium]
MTLPFNELPLFLAATLALNLAPGPDVMFVVAKSMRGSVRTGIAAALGISAGILVHAFLATFGAAALLTAWPPLAKLLQAAGAFYVIWLAANAWLAGPLQLAEGKRSERVGAVAAQGFVTNVLNPKVALFFLLFLPQFVEPAAPLVPQLLFLSLCFIVCGTLVNMAYAAAAARIGRWLAQTPRYRAWPHRVAAVMLAGIGVHLMIDGMRS